MPWVNPIINRTQADVDYADAHRGNLTENKGARSHWTLQRIADNMRYIRAQLIERGINVPEILSRDTWLKTDIPRQSEIELIQTDIQMLRDLGYIKSTTPFVPVLPWTHYEKLNDIERILYDTVVIITGIGAANRFSGTFFSGQEGLR